MAELTEIAHRARARRGRSRSSPRIRERGRSRRSRELGLDGRRNMSFPRGLKALVGFGARRYAVIDVGTNSVKFHVGERARRRRVADGRRPRGGDAARRGARRRPAGSAPEPIARTADGDRGDGRGGRAARRRGDRRGRHRRAADRPATAPSSSPRSASAHRRRGRGHLRRGGGAARLLAVTVGARRRRRHARRVRHRRRQLAVHVRPRRAGRRALQRQRRRRALHRALRARRRRLGGGARRGARGDRRPSSRALDGRPAPGRGRRHGRRGHEPGRRASTSWRRTTPTSSRARVLERGRDRPPDRALPDAQTPTSGARSSGLQPKRAEVILAGACIVRTRPGAARRVVPDRQRPRPAARPAARAVRGRRPAAAAPSVVLEPLQAGGAELALLDRQLVRRRASAGAGRVERPAGHQPGDGGGDEAERRADQQRLGVGVGRRPRRCRRTRAAASRPGRCRSRTRRSGSPGRSSSRCSSRAAAPSRRSGRASRRT